MENEALTMAVPETDTQNQIVVYQPNGVMKIDVRFDGETVWLLQAQIAELFSCSLENVRLHLKNIYACGELEKTATSKESLEVRKEGNRSVTRKFLYYNLDAIISIGYRVNSIVGVRFRQWATQIIKERMFAGAALAAQFAAIDRRFTPPRRTGCQPAVTTHGRATLLRDHWWGRRSIAARLTGIAAFQAAVSTRKFPSPTPPENGILCAEQKKEPHYRNLKPTT